MWNRFYFSCRGCSFKIHILKIINFHFLSNPYFYCFSFHASCAKDILLYFIIDKVAILGTNICSSYESYYTYFVSKKNLVSRDVILFVLRIISTLKCPTNAKMTRSKYFIYNLIYLISSWETCYIF